MFTLFTAWGYEVSILEFTAAIVSLIGVYLGTTGKQITWPWWVASSALYAIKQSITEVLQLNLFLLDSVFGDGLAGGKTVRGLLQCHFEVNGYL